MLKRSVLAAALLTMAPAFASKFYLVVPLDSLSRGDPAANIHVTLNAFDLPPGVVGSAYEGFDFNSVLQVSGDPELNRGKVGWALIDGALPEGLQLHSDGTIAGVPVAEGNHAFTVQASYRGKSGQQEYQVLTYKISVALAGASLPPGTKGESYAYDLSPLAKVAGDLSNITAPIEFRLDAGSALPAGLNLTQSGLLSGTPSTPAENQRFTVVAAYKGVEGAQQYSVTVKPGAFDFSPTISAQTTGYNLRNAALASGWDGVSPLRATVTIGSGVLVGGASAATYAFTTGTNFPADTSITLINRGTIVGSGGAGGSYGTPGSPGGPAIHAGYPITIYNLGTIAGGGGGGAGSMTSTVSNVLAGGAGGGGGQGFGAAPGGARDPAFAGAQYPQGQAGGSGSINAPGNGGAGTLSGYYPNQFSSPWYAASGNAGNGGALGSPGAASGPGWGGAGLASLPGGRAGYSVVGIDKVTWSGMGTVLGPTQ